MKSPHNKNEISDSLDRDNSGKWVLGIFWFLALSAIIMGDYYFGYNAKTCDLHFWRIIFAIVVGITCFTIFLVFVHRLTSTWLLITCCVVIIGIGFGILVIAGDITYALTTFLMIITVVSSILSCLALYYEKFSKYDAIEWSLVHNRYLEYLKHVIWALGFIFVAYIAWRLQKMLMSTGNTQQLDTGISSQSNINQILTFIALIRMAVVLVGAVLTITYSANLKLRQIEVLKYILSK